MNEQEQHIDQFLTSSNYHQLSANQQKHAQDILTRFNNQMANDQHLTCGSCKSNGRTTDKDERVSESP